MGLKEVFETRGFSFFEVNSKEDAVTFLCEACIGKTVSFGGSMTVQEMGLYDALKTTSDCSWHWKQDPDEAISAAQVFITSANAVSETGEIVNIDGHCNRVSGSLYGHDQVYFIIGENKLTPDPDVCLGAGAEYCRSEKCKTAQQKYPMCCRRCLPRLSEPRMHLFGHRRFAPKTVPLSSRVNSDT